MSNARRSIYKLLLDARRIAVPSMLAALVSAAAAGAFPTREMPYQSLVNIEPEAVLRALRGAVTNANPAFDLRIYGPEDLLGATGLSPLNIRARATSWLAVLPIHERNAAVWVVATPSERGVAIRSGVFRARSPSAIGRFANALTDRLPARWQPPETRIARMIGERFYELPTPLRSY